MGSHEQHETGKTCFLFHMNHVAERKKTRYKAHLVAQGVKQVLMSAFDDIWAPVPNTATSRALFAVAAANGR